MDEEAKLNLLREEITQLKAAAVENQSHEEKLIQDLQSKIEEEVQLSMDLDQAKSETRRLQKNVASLQESVSEHRAMVRAAEDDKLEEAEFNSEVARHQTLLAARENAVDALAAVSEALQLSELEDDSIDGGGDTGVNTSVEVDELLNLIKKQSVKEGDKEESSDSDEEVNLDEDKPLNTSIVAESNENNDKVVENEDGGERDGQGEICVEKSIGSPELSGERNVSNESGRSVSRDGDSFSSFMLTHSSSPSNMESLDEQGRDAPEILKLANNLKKTASIVAARTATARGTLARLVRLIKVYIELLPSSPPDEGDPGNSNLSMTTMDSLLEQVNKVEQQGGIDNESSWMEYHMNLKRNTQSTTQYGNGERAASDSPIWLVKLLEWAESYQHTPSSLMLDNTSPVLKSSEGDKQVIKTQESKLNRQFYVGVELNDSDAFLNAQTNALITLARRSGCFTSIVGSRYMSEATSNQEGQGRFSDDDSMERERQQKLLKQRIKDAEEDDKDDELNIGGVLICHAYEWQSWGLFNKGGRWSGLREDLPSPLSSLLPPPCLETTVVSTAGGSGGRGRASSTASSSGVSGGDGGSRRRSSNSFFALRGLGELYTDVNANTSVSFNSTATNEQDDPPIGALGMNWKWLDTWHVDTFTTPESLKALKETKKDREEAEKKKKKAEEEKKLAIVTAEAAASTTSENKKKYNFKSSSSFEDELDMDQKKEEDSVELVPLSYLTDEEGWQYATESKEGFDLLCNFKGATTCGVDEGIAGRPARQLRRRRWSRACQLSGLKTQVNPWPELFKALVSNRKHWMNNNDGVEVLDKEEGNESAVVLDGDEEEEDDEDVNVKEVTLPKSVIGEWSRILKLQHRLAKCSLLVNKYSHALAVAQAMELEADVEAMSNKRKQKAYQETIAEKLILDKNLKKLERTIERAKHDARNEKRLRDALLAQAEEMEARPKTPPPPPSS